MSNKLKFRVVKDYDNDSMTISGYVGKQKVADIIIQEVYGFDFFEGFITEEDYLELIADERYLEVKSLFVMKEYRGTGIANQMMTNLFPIVKKYYSYYRDIVLWASPFSCYMGNYLELSLLKEFYRKFGFISVPIDKIIDSAKDEYNENMMTRKINLD